MSIIGHGQILKFLDESIRMGKISHSYLLVGPPRIGKFQVACELARKLNGVREIDGHPDVSLICQGEKIKIDQIRSLSHYLSLSAHSAKYKIAIVDNIELFTSEAANALLKTLEEPTPHSVLILVASDVTKVLPTIVSRCQILHFYPIPKEELKVGLQSLGWQVDNEIMRLSGGRPGIAIAMLNDSEFYKDKKDNFKKIKEALRGDVVMKLELAKEMIDKKTVKENLEDWLLYFREELLFSLGMSKEAFLDSGLSLRSLCHIITRVIETQKILEETNANDLLALENLLLAVEH